MGHIKDLKTSEDKSMNVLGCLGKTLTGAIIGGFLTAVIYTAIWSHWVETVYEPAIRAAGDDGGSAEGWGFAALPITMLIGSIVGSGLIHLIYFWFSKRTAKS